MQMFADVRIPIDNVHLGHKASIVGQVGFYASHRWGFYGQNPLQMFVSSDGHGAPLKPTSEHKETLQSKLGKHFFPGE